MNSANPVNPGGPAKMNDVAELAGVSIKSVSRVINNEPHVSPRLRAKVEAAIQALDYVPDNAARSLAGSRSFTIGVMLDNPSPNYTMHVVGGAYRACHERQYHLRIDNLDRLGNAVPFAQQVDQILRHNRCDGFVLTPPLSDNLALLDALDAAGTSYCRIAPSIEIGRSPSVQIDDAAAAAQVAELLWRNGHRRIGLVRGHADHLAAEMRRQGFLDRLHELDPQIIVNEANGDFGFEQGIEAGRELLSARKHPTAIFAANDDSAAGVIAACNQVGLTVPGDVSVCGFDDSWVARSVWPLLTTVHQPIERMGYEAARLLLERGPVPDSYVPLRLDFSVIERNSVGTAP